MHSKWKETYHILLQDTLKYPTPETVYIVPAYTDNIDEIIFFFKTLNEIKPKWKVTHQKFLIDFKKFHFFGLNSFDFMLKKMFVNICQSQVF